MSRFFTHCVICLQPLADCPSSPNVIRCSAPEPPQEEPMTYDSSHLDELWFETPNQWSDPGTKLTQIADDLAARGAMDAARETHEAALILRQAFARVEVIQSRLTGVWKAELRRQNGKGDHLDEELAVYRGRTVTHERNR